MVRKEYGVYCVACESFIRINDYEFDPPSQPAPHFFPAEGGEKLRCQACDDVCVYTADRIVHRVIPQSGSMGAERKCPNCGSDKVASLGTYHQVDMLPRKAHYQCSSCSEKFTLAEPAQP